MAIPKPEREAWHIAGFEPLDADEQQRLADVRAELGFDPRTKSHELKHGDDEAKRNAKRVLRALIGADADRERDCVAETELQVLRERGKNNGLADFLAQVGDRLG